MVEYGGPFPSSSVNFLMDGLVIRILFFYMSPAVLRPMEKEILFFSLADSDEILRQNL